MLLGCYSSCGNQSLLGAGCDGAACWICAHWSCLRKWEKINAEQKERGCWGHLALAAAADQWLSAHLSIQSLCWPVALKFSRALQQSVIALPELTWPMVNHLHRFHRLAQKMVGIFWEQDNYFSNASNKIAIYIKRPRVLKVELEVVDEALLNILLPFQYRSQFLLLFLIINWRKCACYKF